MTKNHKWIVLIIILFLFCGCSTVKTTITMPDNSVITVQSKKNGLVMLKKDGIDLTVDNKKPMGIFENLMGILLMKTDINLKNKEGD